MTHEEKLQLYKEAYIASLTGLFAQKASCGDPSWVLKRAKETAELVVYDFIEYSKRVKTINNMD